MENLREIIKEIADIGKEFNLNFSGDAVLDCGTRIFNSLNFNHPNIANGEKPTKPSMPATQSQIETLKKLRVKDLDFTTLTKSEATVLIGEKIEEIRVAKAAKAGVKNEMV